MDRWLVYKMNQYGNPKITVQEVEACDAWSAIQAAGQDTSIICVKLKMIETTTAGI